MDGTRAPALFTRRAPGAPSTFDPVARTVEVVLTSGADVPRSGAAPDGTFRPWIERLDLAGATWREPVPALADHRNLTGAMAGSVSDIRRVGGELRGLVTFAASATGTEIAALVEGGHLAAVSVGYSVEAWQPSGGGDGAPVFVATAWTVREMSFTPIGADDAARVRSAPRPNIAPEELEHMTTTTRGDDAAITRAAESAAIVIGRDEADALANRARAGGWSEAEMKATALAIAVKKGERMRAPFARQIGESYDDPSFLHRARAEALAAQALGRAPADYARAQMDHRGFGGMAEAILSDAGVDTRRLSRSGIISLALQTRSTHTTSDFPGLLISTADRALTGLRDAAPSAVRAVSRPREVPDFRQFSTVNFAGPNALPRVNEGGEVTHGTAFESVQNGTLATYGRAVAITRQMLVNDDLGAFGEAARFWASSIAQTERNLFLPMFAVNGAGFGPTMADGQPLFSTAHGNAQAGTASTAGVGTARRALREQIDLNGNVLGLAPSILLTGPTSETALEQVLSDLAIATSEGNRPIFSNMTLATEAGLTGAPWFAFVDPQLAPVIEYVTLAGRGGVPAFESFTGPEIDGVTIRCLFDVAVVAASWIGAVRMTGA